MELKNLNTYEEFTKLKLNEEISLFDWISKIYKSLSPVVGKLIDSFTKAISKETDISKLYKNTELFITTNVKNVETQFKQATSSYDVNEILNDNIQAIYTSLSALNLNKSFTDKINLSEIFKNDTNLSRVFIDPKKILGENGMLDNYLKNILLPQLYKQSKLEYIKEKFLFEAEQKRDMTTPVEKENSKPEDYTEKNTKNIENKPDENKTIKIDKSKLKPGQLITYKNSKGEMKKAVIVKDQIGVDTNKNIRVDILKEAYSISIDSITNIEEPSQDYINKIKNLSKLSFNWYNNNFIKPIIDIIKENSKNIKSIKTSKVGDLSDYSSEETNNPETVKKMADEIKTLNRNQLIKLRDYIGGLKGYDDPKENIGKL